MEQEHKPALEGLVENRDVAQGRILIVEDDPAMQYSLSQALEKLPYHLHLASSIMEGRQRFEAEDPDVVLLDINLPDGSGRDLLKVLREQNDEVVVIMLTAFPDLRGAVSCMKDGAFDYLVKPFDLTELKLAIQKGMELKNLKNEVIRLKRQDRSSEKLGDIIGDSALTRGLRSDILQIAQKGHSTVLITGESGTGKELVAKALHQNSSRKNGPLVPVNCSAIPENLVESELFGHEKGAFTNATHAFKGVFELASGGTLFLDEVGELPLATQPKLLRALETRRIKRLGGSREIPIDIRLVSATNRNLEEAVAKGGFREDLYYRLNVVPIVIPSLRERREDIMPILHYSMEAISGKNRMQPLKFSPAAVRLLEKYSWPGNVREMRNLIERLLMLHGQREVQVEIGVKKLPEEIRDSVPVGIQDPESVEVLTLDEVEFNHIRLALNACQGNKSEASRRLGISRNTLKEKLKRYSI
ncbi:MAG: sigma-54 dependent transcriptional regulator [Deltaproteobacteria bacterium]|nr:sigma-54 dependent transcriptional regulator [Deltaproteobacteria bacterium]